MPRPKCPWHGPASCGRGKPLPYADPPPRTLFKIRAASAAHLTYSRFILHFSLASSTVQGLDAARLARVAALSWERNTTSSPSSVSHTMKERGRSSPTETTQPCLSQTARLFLVRWDQVTLSNINRQSIALHSTVGRDKTEVMKEKIRDICPGIQVECRQIFILPENVDDLFDQKLDYIVDAIDTVSAKIAVAEKAREYKIPLISSMGTGNKLHGELFQIGDLSETSVCPLCRVMRRELKKRGIEHLKVLYSTEKPIPPQAPEKGEDEGKRLPPGSISFVPPVAGLLIAGEVVRDLLEL